MEYVCDPMTIAYVAIGAKKALQRHLDAGRTLDEERFLGELGYIESVINKAPELDRLGKECDEAGVFLYGVAEPFGEQLGEDLLREDHLPVNAINATALAVSLLNGNG